MSKTTGSARRFRLVAYSEPKKAASLIRVCNDSSEDIWIKFYAHTKGKGILIRPGDTWEVPGGLILIRKIYMLSRKDQCVYLDWASL